MDINTVEIGNINDSINKSTKLSLSNQKTIQDFCQIDMNVDSNNQINLEKVSDEKIIEIKDISKDENTALSSINVVFDLILNKDKIIPFSKNQDVNEIADSENEDSENSIEEIEPSKLDKNLKFYKSLIKSEPRGDYLEKILNWSDDLLEIHHGYIQWLFPNRDPGMNLNSQPLQQKELEIMKKDAEIIKKLQQAFQRMLKFYGMKINEENFKIIRKKNYKERYRNLKENSHNFLRITRILKCLAEFELFEYQYKWIEFLIEEIFVTKQLRKLENSMKNFFIHTIQDDEKRKYFLRKILEKNKE